MIFLETVDAKLAKVIFKDNVSMIIGGSTRRESNQLSKWAYRLKIPVLSLIPNNGGRNPQAFFVAPDLKLMTETLAKFAKGQKVKKIAIVSTSQNNPLFTNFLIKSLESKGISFKPNSLQPKRLLFSGICTKEIISN